MKSINKLLICGAVLSVSGCAPSYDQAVREVNQKMIAESGAQVGQHANINDPNFIKLTAVFDNNRHFFSSKNVDSYNIDGWTLCDDKRETYDSYDEHQAYMDKMIKAANKEKVSVKTESGSLLGQMASDDSAQVSHHVKYKSYFYDTHTLTYIPAGENCTARSL